MSGAKADKEESGGRQRGGRKREEDELSEKSDAAVSKELVKVASWSSPVAAGPPYFADSGPGGGSTSATKHCHSGQQRDKQPGRPGAPCEVQVPFFAGRPGGREDPSGMEGNLQQPQYI